MLKRLFKRKPTKVRSTHDLQPMARGSLLARVLATSQRFGRVNRNGYLEYRR